MTVITEVELREMWQSGRGSIAPLPRHARLTPAAKDFVKDWGIALTFGEPESPAPPAEPKAESGGIPVAPPPKDAPAPRILHRGKPVMRVPKPAQGSSVRLLRGGKPFLHHPADVLQPALSARQKLHTAHAVMLRTLFDARRMNFSALADALGTLADYTQNILSGSTVIPLKLPQHPPQVIRQTLADPHGTLGIGTLHITATDGEMLLTLHVLYAHLQEVVALAETGEPLRRAIISLAQTVFYLMLLLKADKFSWQPPTFAARNPNR